MLAKPASLVVLLAVLLQATVGSFALSTRSPKTTDLNPRQSSISSTSTTSVETFTRQWTAVSTGFSSCYNTFQQRATVEVAYTSVTTLYQTCSQVANTYSSCASCASAGQSYATTFRTSIETSFKSWSEIIVIGQQTYAAEWQSRFVSVFSRFDTWVRAANTACSSFNLKLDTIITGLGLNLNIFVGIYINLGGILDLNIGGLIGGILKREALLLE